MIYIDKKELEQELKWYISSCEFKENGKIKKRGKISERLGWMILEIVKGLAEKRSWSGYTWKDSMISEGVLMVILYVHNYKPDISNSNAFAYIDLIAQNAFIQYIKKQKKHSYIKQYLFDKKDNMDLEIYQTKALDYENLKEND